MKRLAVIMLMLGTLTCSGFVWMQQYMPVSASAAPAGWTDSYSTNDVGYAFWLSEIGTNTTPAWGPVGSILDASAISNSANHGVCSNLPTPATSAAYTLLGTNSLGQEVYSWLFDGADDSSRIIHNARYALGNGATDIPFTIGAWLCKTSAAVQGVVISRLSTSTGSYALQMSTWNLAWLQQSRDSSAAMNARVWSVTVGSNVMSNVWLHVAVVNDGTSTTNACRFYTNGAPAAFSLAAQATNYVAMTNSVIDVKIGAQAYTSVRFFPGYLADVFICRTNWSAAEVLTHFQNTGGSSFPYNPTNTIRNRLPVGAYP